MATSTPLHWLSLREAAERIAAGDVGSLELTEHLLARIERLDPILRSFARVTPEPARAAARAADEARARGQRCGPLHGVPIAVKDLCDTAGVATAAGMPFRRDNVPERDATVVARLVDAGAVILGKLTMTEGASALHHPDVPVPRNPWSLEHWAGASSSGSGVATAAGLCFASLGSDTAGSIRYPSAVCGLAGIKPTYGRVSRAGVFPLAATLDHVGPMARTVADAASVLQVIAGPDPRDPTASLRTVPDLLAAGGDLSGVRIGLDDAYAREGSAPEVGLALTRSIAVLEKQGATIVPVQLPGIDDALAAHAVIFHADVACAHGDLGLHPAHADAYGPHLREIIEIGLAISGTDVARAQAQRFVFQGQLARTFEAVDLLICPPMPLAPPPQALFAENTGGDFREMGAVLRFTAPFDLSGNPSLTLRSGFTEAGLPLAVQLVGRPFDEALLVRAGRCHERELSDGRVPADPA